MNIEEHTEAKECERVRNILNKALDECKLPYDFQKDRMLSEWTREVILAKI